jgi:uncharacterized protein (TIGR02246 family)
MPMHTDEQSIRRLFAEWQSATEEGDVERLGPLLADDVVFLTPGQQPMRGRESFLEAFRESMTQYRIEAAGDIKELHVADNMAWCWSHVSVTATPHRNGLPMRRSGNTLTILRKREDQGWVIVRDANMLTSQPAL